MFRLYRGLNSIIYRVTQRSYVIKTSPKKSPARNMNNLVFGKYLLTTNIISSGILMWLGDLCQQEIEYKQGKLKCRYDYKRMGRMLLVGLALGPIHHYYYLYLAKIMPKRDLTTVATKIGLDQFLMSPVCIALFFYSMGILEMKPLQKMNEEIAHKFINVYVMDWCVWVPTQYINFNYVPVKYQVFYINAVTMFYNIFLSYIKHYDAERSVVHHKTDVILENSIIMTSSDTKKSS